MLEPDEVNVRLEAASGFAIAQDAGLVVALDTVLSSDLKAEGRAREIVHRVQTLRKEAGLNVADRIQLEFAADEELASVLEAFGDYVRRETLAVGLKRRASENGHAWKGMIDGLRLELALRRAEA